LPDVLRSGGYGRGPLNFVRIIENLFE
jgi:hypothetical protein